MIVIPFCDNVKLYHLYTLFNTENNIADKTPLQVLKLKKSYLQEFQTTHVFCLI